MNTNEPHDNAIAYIRALWAYKRRLVHDEPNPSTYGLDMDTAAVLARQVHIEFESQAKERAMAVNRRINA